MFESFKMNVLSKGYVFFQWVPRVEELKRKLMGDSNDCVFVVASNRWVNVHDCVSVQEEESNAETSNLTACHSNICILFIRYAIKLIR